jgi:hypothetical protein
MTADSGTHDNTHTTDSDVLSRQLDAIAVAIGRARTFEYEYGLSSRHSRKSGASTLHSLRRWQQATASAPASDTVSPVVVDGTVATRAASADKPANAVCTEELPVPVSPVTTVRIPEPLREQAEAYGREHRWTFGEVTRVALERLVGYHHDDDTEPRRAA